MFFAIFPITIIFVSIYLRINASSIILILFPVASVLIFRIIFHNPSAFSYLINNITFINSIIISFCMYLVTKFRFSCYCKQSTWNVLLNLLYLIFFKASDYIWATFKEYGFLSISKQLIAILKLFVTTKDALKEKSTKIIDCNLASFTSCINVYI